MAFFDTLISEVASATGLPLTVHGDCCDLSTEKFPLTVKYRESHDDLLLLAAIRSEGVPLLAATMRRALELAFNGERTRGCHLGLCNGALVLSHSLPAEGVNAESFAARLLAFTEVAQDIAAELDAAEALPEEGDDFFDEPSHASQNEFFLQV